MQIRLISVNSSMVPRMLLLFLALIGTACERPTEHATTAAPLILQTPEYPFMAHQAGAIGCLAECQVSIDRSGSAFLRSCTGSAGVMGSPSHPIVPREFEEAIRVALAHWRFPKANREYQRTITFEFRIEYQDRPPGVYSQIENPLRVTVIAHRRKREPVE
jgi:hypothetical protein